MGRRSGKTRWRAVGALVCALGVVVSACGDDDGGPDGTTGGNGGGGDGGVVTVGADGFPQILNTYLPEGATFWTAAMVSPALARGYRVTPDLEYEPWLFREDCTVSSEEPFTVSCTLVDDATWSDGEPLTAEDFEFTWQTIMDPDSDVWSRMGYDRITDFRVVSPTELEMVFDGVYAPFRELWAGSNTAVLPKHVLEGQDFGTVWNDCICDPETGEPIGSGPFLVESYTPDEEVTLVRNDAYWGEPARLEQVVFKPVAPESLANALRTGEVDVIYPLPDPGLVEEIRGLDGVAVEAGLGPVWEHFDILTTVPGLDDLEVRRAIATAMPRQAIVDTVVAPVNPDAVVLDNLFFMSGTADYEPHWEIYPHRGDPIAASEILEAAGWFEGPDGVREKDGARLGFTLGTSAGDPGRELAQQIIVEALSEIGIELRIENTDDFVDVRVPGLDYETAIWALGTGPDPGAVSGFWLSSEIPGQEGSGGFNTTAVSIEQVDELLLAADSEPDAGERAKLFNQADQLLAEEGVSTIPLYQQPSVLAFADRLAGLVDNASIDTFTWNIEAWSIEG
ncbi:MAG: peptide ABC transporter substrate-binding protein [Acidimicrobiia bacterium]|nr:peptide ABC transporter substrate-binding protein [Acidimicrobiia bacterium]